MNVIPILSPDRQLEKEIEHYRWLMEWHFRSGNTDQARRLFEFMKERIASRTPARVSEIERERGFI
jgi:pentatricopeptide repeat protein